jgi:hypothetical protein
MLLGLLTILPAGCGARKPIAGRVVFKEDSQPFTTGGYVLMESAPPNSASVVGVLDDQGRFQLNKGGQRPDPGTYRVCIQPQIAEDADVIDPGKLFAERAKLIHPRFLDFQTSGLTCTIVADRDDYTLEVERPPAR